MGRQANNPLLTIGVPLYNMERYVGQCLDSMLPGGVAPEGLEIIVVNDGSTDGSLSIAQEYSRRFPDAVIVIDKPNGGHGSCINAAVAAARGRYFKIVDSDDWLDTDSLVSHLAFLKECDADAIVCNFRENYSDGAKKEVSFDKLLPAGRPIPAEEVFGRFSALRGASSYLPMHSLTYRTRALEGVRITEHSFYVDLEYISLPLANCGSFAFQPVSLYQYRLGRAGQSVDPQVIKRRIEQVYRILLRLFACHDSLGSGHSALRHYMQGLLEDQCWGYLARTDSAEGFAHVQAWWRAHESETIHPYARMLRRDFTEDFQRRDARVRLMNLVRALGIPAIVSRIGMPRRFGRR